MGDPILVCTQHFAVEKDLLATGMLNSIEGELCLNAGKYAPNWAWEIVSTHTPLTTGETTTTKNPFIWLAQGGIFGNYNTLEIRVTGDANGNWNWGNFACGDITSYGNLQVNSIVLPTNRASPADGEIWLYSGA